MRQMPRHPLNQAKAAKARRQLLWAKGALKWIRKETEREGRELVESDGSEDEGGDSNSDQEEMEPDTSCQDCNKLLVDERDDWWCPDCGYGLCADCRAGSSYAHVLACTFAHKRESTRTSTGTPTEKEKKKK